MLYLNIGQVENILRAAYAESKRDHLLLLLSFQHGLRASEVAALKLQDVSDGYIRVARVKHSLETCQPLMASENVLFDEPGALKAWLQERVSETDALFPSRKGHNCMRPDSVGKIAVYYMNAASVPEKLAHHHSLKHALASLLIRSKVDLAFVKQALGHRSISSTIHYVHIEDFEATEKAQSAIQAALS